MGCTCATFLFIVIAGGAWRWLAMAPIALAILLVVEIVRRVLAARDSTT